MLDTARYVCIAVLFASGTLCCPPYDGCVGDTFSISCRSYIDKHYKETKHVHLCKYYNTTLYISNILKKVPRAENITVTSSNLVYLFGPTKDNNIKLLRINNSTLKRIPDSLFVHMKKLEVLDIRNNSVDKLPTYLDTPFTMKAIYVENNKWNCSLNMSWAMNYDRTIIKDHARMRCFGDPYSNKSVAVIAIFLHNSQINCPLECECTMPGVTTNLKSDRILPTVVVNCSGNNFTELPHLLPNFTTILHLEYNNITDLTPLINNRLYKSVLELYLDHNKVSSIAVLEGGYWLAHFRVLSLSYNRLTQVPIYALENALKLNTNIPGALRVYLRDNPWRCDCMFTPRFQELLMKYEIHVRDIQDIRCSAIEGDPNSKLPILSLTRSSVCHLPGDYTIRALDLLNIILASLIVLILSKLGYDYYYYKKTGRLPWIVTKMP